MVNVFNTTSIFTNPKRQYVLTTLFPCMAVGAKLKLTTCAH